jgi:hypothetical protein
MIPICSDPDKLKSSGCRLRNRLTSRERRAHPPDGHEAGRQKRPGPSVNPECLAGMNIHGIDSSGMFGVIHQGHKFLPIML